jgi:ribose transport system permease protein
LSYRKLPREASQLLILFVLLAFFGIINPRFLTLESFQVMARSMAAPGFVAIGIGLCAINGMIDISIGAMAGLGSVIFATLVVKLGLPWPLAVLATIGTGAITGLANITAILKTRITPILVSIGALFVYRGLSNAISSGTSVFPLPEWMKEVANDRVMGVSWAFWLFVVVMIVMDIVVRTTVWGLEVKATGSDREIAFLTEVNVDKISRQVYMLTGILAMVGGLATSWRIQAGSAMIGTNWEFRGLVGAALGGVSLFGFDGSFLGLFLGIAIAQVINNGVVAIGLPGDFQEVALGVTLVIAVTYDIWQQRRGEIVVNKT